MTGYDPSGTVVEWAVGDVKRIYELCFRYDRLQSKASKTPCRKHAKSRVVREMRCIQRRLHNLVDDCHRRLAVYMCDTYRVVLLPAFDVKRMVQRDDRRIGSRTARAMCTWGHYRLRQHVLFKASQRPWCKVIVCTEEFTSKTCGRCGALHDKLGGSKLFVCPSCDCRLDRDVNAARNILLLYLTKHNLTHLA